MKRKLIWLLCACILLSGCRSGASLPVPTELPSVEAIQPTQAASHIPLLEQGTSLEESKNLFYIPNGTVEKMTAPEMRLLGNGLLLSEHTDNKLVLKHISLEDGALISEGAVTAAQGTKLCIGSGEIGLCDRMTGQISILDEQFRPIRAYDVPAEGDDWYLNSELDTLFIFFADRGLLARNLVTKEDIWLVDNGFQVSAKGSGSSWVIFSYTDRADQKTYTRCVNLSTSTLETIPVGGAVNAGYRQGNTWLIQGGEAEGFYALALGDAVSTFTWNGNSVRLLSPKQHLLATDHSGRNLTLFETDGSFLSQGSLPTSSHAAVGGDFVWSGYWDGYFFTDFIDSSCRLMFWDVNGDCENKSLQILPQGETQQSQPVVEAALYDRAAQLSQRFGVDIRIAEQCTLDYSHYDTYALTDPVFIRSALDTLEQSLSQYPEGFLQQLPYGSIESIRIELVGGLSAKDNATTHPASIGAFAQDRGAYFTIVMDGFLLQQQTLFHEMSHIIDAHLEWDSLIREDALYNQDRWLALQPEGFRYTMSYTEIPENVLSLMESGYFITEYSLTYPTEDRAVLMASAMENNSTDFQSGSGKQVKMRFYADCIRDCFETDGWPDIAVWEQVLQ